MIKEIVATTGVLLGFMHFLGFSLHAPWYRLFAFPFRPPQDLAFRERNAVFIATLCFAGGALFWAFGAGLMLFLLASLYER